MTPPNVITLARVASVPVVVWLILASFSHHERWAAFAYVVSASTDSLDGYLARSRNWKSVTGAFLDPLADKLLVTGALMALVEQRRVSTWVALAIIAREFAVTGLRLIAVSGKEVISASGLGKAKAFSQNVMIVTLLLISGMPIGLALLIGLVLVLTIWSFVDYLWQARGHFT